MPESEKQRRAAFAEIRKRKAGGGRGMFEGMSTGDLEKYAHQPLHKKKKAKGAKGKRGMSPKMMASALKSMD